MTSNNYHRGDFEFKHAVRTNDTVRRSSAIPQLAIRHSQRAWAIIALAALTLAFFPAPASLAAPVDRHLHLEAGSFAYAPAVIAVNPGDRVTLELAATDVVHGLYLDGYDLNLVAEPGQTARLTFVADRAGAFRFRCSVTCGPLHPFMIGKLTVGPNWRLYRAVGLAVLAAVAGVWLVKQPAISDTR